MIIVICGPTGVGKTKLSIELAKRYNAEIINADSMQTYIGMDIATAKIKESEKENIPHHLFDINKPEDMYTIYDYQKDARKKIEEISSRGKNIIFVGGSGLYIKSALYNLEFSEEKEKKDYSNLSNDHLIERLNAYVDTDTIDTNNRKRLERLLEKYENGSIIGNNANDKVYDFICIGLTLDRDILYKRINDRVDEMVNDGLIEEAKGFYDKHLYNRRRREESITTTNDLRFSDAIAIMNKVIELIKNHGVYKEFQVGLWEKKIGTSYNRFSMVDDKYKNEFFNLIKDDFLLRNDEYNKDEISSKIKQKHKMIYENVLKSENYKIFELNMEIDKIQDENKKLKKQNSKLRNENKKMNYYRNQYELVLKSNSWKITKPLRAITNLFKRS